MKFIVQRTSSAGKYPLSELRLLQLHSLCGQVQVVKYTSHVLAKKQHCGEETLHITFQYQELTVLSEGFDGA